MLLRQEFRRGTWYAGKQSTCQVPWLPRALTSCRQHPFSNWSADGGHFSLIPIKVFVSWQWLRRVSHTPSPKPWGALHVPQLPPHLCTHFKADSPLSRAAPTPLAKNHSWEWVFPGIWSTDTEPPSLLNSVVLNSTTQRGNLEICGGGFLGSHNN